MYHWPVIIHCRDLYFHAVVHFILLFVLVMCYECWLCLSSAIYSLWFPSLLLCTLEPCLSLVFLPHANYSSLPLLPLGLFPPPFHLLPPCRMICANFQGGLVGQVVVTVTTPGGGIAAMVLAAAAAAAQTHPGSVQSECLGGCVFSITKFLLCIY